VSRNLTATIDRPGVLSTAEAKKVRPPNCDSCGAPMQLRWVDVSTVSDVEPRWQLDIVRCLTSGCPVQGARGSRR